MKKIFTFLLLLLSMSTYAHDFVVNGIAYQISDDACIVARFCTGTNPETGKLTYDNDYYQGDIIIPSSVTYGGKNYTVMAIGEAAFYKSRITSISIPETVTTIMDGAFEGSELLSAINIGKNIIQINDNENLVEVFNGCFALEEINVDPDNTVYTSIDGVLLSKDKKTLFTCPAGKKGSYLTPSGVETIKKSAFYKCKYLTDITFSNDVISIGKTIMKNCSNLKKLFIGKNVSSIGDGAFKTNYGLDDVTNYSTVPQSITYDTFDYNTISSAVLHVPTGCTSAYADADVWKEFSSILDDATTGFTPIAKSEEFVISEIIDEGTDLSDNVVSNTYFNLDVNNGDGYDIINQALILNSTTSEAQMSAIQNAKVGDASIRDNYRGVIFEIAASQGIITIDAKTIGTHVLMVQVGNNSPTKVTKSEQGKMDISYDVLEPTYVYLYARTENSSSARLDRAPGTADNSVLLYGYKVTIRPAIIPGDVNGDGVVNVTDIVATVNYIMEKPSPDFNKDAADLNGDGSVNVTDIVKMVSIIMSGEN